MKRTDRITVIGSGSWGSALADMFAKNGINTILYVRNTSLFKTIVKTRLNSNYLPNIELNRSLNITNDIKEAVGFGDIIVISVPVKYLRGVLAKIKPYIRNNQIIVSSSKGIENETFFRPSEVISDVFEVDSSRIAAMSGPNFAKEVAQNLPAATVIASKNIELSKKLQILFSNSYFRVYSSSDIVGVEVAGALKNIIAIASGISDGLKLGNNAKASLITRGLAEIMKFGLYFGAKSETFMGLAGVGDLVLTCTGNLSRNRKIGLDVVIKGNIKEILNSMTMVAEGVNTAKSIFEWSIKNDIDMPISKCVYKVLYEGKGPEEAVKNLMERPLKSEF